MGEYSHSHPEECGEVQTKGSDHMSETKPAMHIFFYPHPAPKTPSVTKPVPFHLQSSLFYVISLIQSPTEKARNGY